MTRSLALAVIGGATLAVHAPLPFAGAGSVGGGRSVAIVAVSVLVLLPVLLEKACRSVPRPAAALARMSAALLAASLCGAGLAGGEILVRLALRWPSELAGSERMLSGTIVSLPRALPGAFGPPGVRFDVSPASLSCTVEEPACAMPARAPGRLQLLDRSSGRVYRAGQRWRWRVRLQPPEGSLNAGAFDRERWLLSERIDAVASVRAGPVEFLGGGTGPAGWLDRQREHLSLALLELPAAAAGARTGDVHVIEALALGRSERITPRWRERLQDTGTAHLIAISGLHVGLVFAAVYAFGLRASRWRDRPVGRRLRGSPCGEIDGVCVPDVVPRPPDQPLGVAHRLRALLQPDVAAVLAASGYAALAGFGLPVQRALVMLAVLVLVRRQARLVAPGSTLALAVIAVLLFDPLAPLSGGFWLSAGAVAVLIGSGVGRVDRARARWATRRWQTLRAQGWLTLALIPIGAFAFQQVSLVSGPVNLVAIPFVATVVVPLSLLTTLLVALDAVGSNAVLWLTLQAVAVLRSGLDMAASVPAAATIASLPGPATLGSCLVALMLAGLATSIRPGPSWLLIVPVLLLLALPAALWVTLGRPVRGIELHVLDVGHGLAALVLTPQATVLIDTGGGRGDATQAERVVMPYLQSLGRHRLDTLILSHLDADHAAGLPYLARRFDAMPIFAPDVDAVLDRLHEADVPPGPDVGPAAHPVAHPVAACRAGEGFALDGLTIDFLHPAAHDAGSRNDLSCVVLLSTGYARLLLSGDIEAAAEQRLVERAGSLPVDVLVAPHHGSNSSSSEVFVAAFPARDVVFPVGRRSRWGFPHAITRMRYRMTGAHLHTIGDTGAIAFRYDPPAAPGASADCCAPLSARGNAPRLWRKP